MTTNHKMLQNQFAVVSFYTVSMVLIGVFLNLFRVNSGYLFIFMIPILMSSMFFKRQVSYFMIGVFFIILVASTFTAALPELHPSFLSITIVVISLIIMAEFVYRVHSPEKEIRQTFLTSQEKFKSIFEHLPIGVYRADLEGVVMDVNPALVKMFGYTDVSSFVEDHSKLPFNTDLPDQKNHQLLDGQDGVVLQQEFPIQTKEGYPLWVRNSSHIVVDACGKVQYIDGVFEDITDHKSTEAALTREHNLLRTLIDQLPDRIYAKDTECRKILANTADMHAAGITRMEDILGKTDFDLYPPELAASYWADDQAVIKSTVPLINREEPGMDMNGNQRWITTTKVPIVDEHGTVIGLVGIGHDITDRRTVEEALRESEERFRLLYNNTPVMLESFDRNGNIQSVSDYWLQTLGYLRSDVLGRRVVDFMTPESSKHFTEEVLCDLLTKGSCQEIALQLIKKDDEPIDFLFSATNERDSNGQIVRFLAVLEYVTERYQVEKALHEANQSLTVWVQELERRNQEAKLFNRLSELLQSCQTSEDAYTVIGQMTSELFNQQSGGLYVLNNSRTLLEAVMLWGDEGSQSGIGELIFKPEECWALRRGRAHTVADMTNKLICRHLGTTPEERAAHIPYICVPLTGQGEMLGLITQRINPDLTPEQCEQLAVQVAERSALALANLKLRETLRSQAIRDPLTGLFNRRYLEETLEREISRAARHHHTLGVVMFDIDHFKKFNDDYGHHAGDILLQELGHYIQSHTRSEDVASRYGGEEFTLVMPDSSEENTINRVDQIREGIKHLQTQYRGQPLGSVTVSFGVASFPDNGQTSDELLQKADDALYQSKKLGGDRVMAAC
jgi:diguanylate cyclase (GGDEF)-like protein/PAS domain S-box-containing protein